MENKIPEIEKKIYNNLNFTNLICEITLKYINNGQEHPSFKVNEVKSLLKSFKYPYEYGENTHALIIETHNNFIFKVAFYVKRNSVIPYYIILKNGNYFAPKVTNLYSLLNHLPYNEGLLNPNFKINTLNDLGNYVSDIIYLCNKFSKQYINEIENGNIE